MLLLLAFPLVLVVAAVYRLVQTIAPSNVLIAHVRFMRPTLRIASGLVALTLLLISVAHAITVAIASGAPGWLNLVVLVLLWDAIRFGVLGGMVGLRTACAAVTRRCAGRTTVRRRAVRAEEPAALRLSA